MITPKIIAKTRFNLFRKAIDKGKQDNNIHNVVALNIIDYSPNGKNLVLFIESCATIIFKD